MLVQLDIILNELLYGDLPCNSFSERLCKAKFYADYSQKTLSKATGLSLSAINELEAGYRDTLTKNTLIKLLTVLDKKILCDDYCNFILNQENEITKLINAYNINILPDLLKVHRSAIKKWTSGKYQISRKQYELICSLIADIN